MTVVSDKPYLDSQMGALQQVVNDTKSMSISSAGYGSTTSIPSKEPPIIQKYLEAAQSFSQKLSEEAYNIYAVGDDIANMDNFLAGESTNLGFNVLSNNVDVTDLTNESKTNLSELLGKEVPVVQGYNNNPGVVSTGAALGTAAGSSYTPSSSGGGSYYGGGGSSISTPTSVQTTPIANTAQAQSNTPATNDVHIEPNAAISTNTPVGQPQQTEQPQTQPAQPAQQSQTVINNYYYNNGGGGGGSSEVVTYGEPTEETPNVDENFGKQPIVMDEPATPQEVQPEEITQEIPLQEEVETTTEVTETEEVIPVDPVAEVTPDPSAEASAKTLKTMAVLAGAGLTAGAAAVAIHEYKKTKDDNTDEEDDDFNYDDGGEV